MGSYFTFSIWSVNGFFRLKSFYVFLFFIALSSNGITAQYDAEYASYMYNLMIINPAYAGNGNLLKVKTHNRYQWAGVEGAPKTFTLSLDAPVGIFKDRYRKWGMGLSFGNDKIGAINNSSLTSNWSYTVLVGEEELLLSFGLAAGIVMNNVDYSKLIVKDPFDGELLDRVNRFYPVGGLGFFFHDNRTWYAGLSLPNILSANYYDDVLETTVTEKTTLYVIGGYIFDLNYNLKMKPALMWRNVPGIPWSVNVSTNFIYNNMFTVGVSYRVRSAEAFAAMSSFQLSPRFTIGYSYGVGVGALGGFDLGSHELFLSYSIGINKKRLGLPRLY